MSPLSPRFEQFIRERQYLHNVSANTVVWYRESLKWLPSETPTQPEVNDTVVRMRAAGRQISSCNCALRAINAYLHWASGASRKCGSACTHPRLGQLKEPHLVMPTLAPALVSRLVTLNPRDRITRRLHAVLMVLLDTGCRIGEALKLRVCDLDFDNLLVTLDGKGSKQRVVPFSFALRKLLFRYVTDFSRRPDMLLFATQNGTELARNNILRGAKALCESLGVAAPRRTLHAFRHTFAVNYLRRGGSVFHLQKVLGHSSLEMTRRYANLVTSDLQAVHEKVSLLSLR